MEVDPLLLKKNTKKNNDELFLFFYIFNHFYNITHSYISLKLHQMFLTHPFYKKHQRCELILWAK